MNFIFLGVEPQGVDLTNILWEAFTCSDAKSAENTAKPSVFFLRSWDLG